MPGIYPDQARHSASYLLAPIGKKGFFFGIGTQAATEYPAGTQFFQACTNELLQTGKAMSGPAEVEGRFCMFADGHAGLFYFVFDFIVSGRNMGPYPDQ